MYLTKKSLERFRSLYLRIFSEELSDEQVKKKAEYLLELYRIIYKLPGVEEFFDNKTQDEESE